MLGPAREPAVESGREQEPLQAPARGPVRVPLLVPPQVRPGPLRVWCQSLCYPFRRIAGCCELNLRVNPLDPFAEGVVRR